MFPANATPVARVFSVRNGRLYKRCLDAKRRHADGEPLQGEDFKLLMKVLNKHPRASEKIGAGVASIVVGPYVCRSRCFFVIRIDGSVEDFSVRKCLGAPPPPRNERMKAAMASFRFGYLVSLYNAYLRGGAR